MWKQTQYSKNKINIPQISAEADVAKDGSWNGMVNAHLSGQIFASFETGPYCFVDEEVINPLDAENHIQI